MKFSDYTLTVLRNFASINSGVVLVPGQVQSTISEHSSILVKAKLEDTFPTTFGIYDLNQFLGNITTFNSPEITFSDKVATLNDGSMRMDYFSCPPNLIKTPPDKPFDLVSPDVTFNLPFNILSKLLKLGAMNSLEYISLVGKNGEINMKVHDTKNDTSNFASTLVGKLDNPETTFTESFKTENLKLIQDDYLVSFKHEKFAKFVGTKTDINYFIAFEKK